MQLYLIRHAQSDNNSKPEEQRVEDPGITPLGHQQASSVAKWIGDLKVDHLVTSGFRRTLETSKYLVDTLECQPTIWRDLHEVGGCYRGYRAGEEEGRPGMNAVEIAESFPEFDIDPLIGPEGWWACKPYETGREAMHRAELMIEQFRSQFGNTSDIVVAVIHADFKVCMLRQLLGNSFVNRLVGPMLNCGVTKFSFKDDQWRLDLLNSISHLRPNQIS